MDELDRKAPPPQPKTLEAAQRLIDRLWVTLGEALEQIEPLKEQVGTDSSHSSKAPSNDSPKSRAERRKKPRSSRAQGGQPGHPKHERAPVSASEVDAVECFFPAGCDHCGSPLELSEEPAVRHPVFDLPQRCVIRSTHTSSTRAIVRTVATRA